LKPAGRLAICHFDWLPLPDSLVAATEALILSHNPDWPLAGGTGTYPQWERDATAAGFRNPQTFSFDIDEPYTAEAWRGRIRASAGVGGSLPPEKVAAFDRDLAAMMAQDFPGERLLMPHRCWGLVCRRPSAR